MQKQILLRRGPHEKRGLYVPDVGEPVYVTDRDQLRIGDGHTPGGILTVGKPLVVATSKDFPVVKQDWKRKLLSWLGEVPVYSFAYILDTETFYVYKPYANKWLPLVTEEKFAFIQNLHILYPGAK